MQPTISGIEKPMTLTQALMTTLKDETYIQKGDLPLLMEHARKNKVLLQFLRNSRIEGTIRQEQEEALSEVYLALVEVAYKIQNLDYAVIKFFKPMAYLPSDIDLLLKKEQISILSRILQKLGYNLILIEPNCLTFKGKVVIDVYINPDVLNIPYMTGEELLQFTTIVEVDGVKIKKLTDEAEVVLVLSHAVYKEQIITLNDYYAAKLYLNSECVKIAAKFKVSSALEYVINAFHDIEMGRADMPLKIPFKHTVKLFLNKIITDKLTRNSLPQVCLKLFDQRAPMLIKSRLLRQTY